MSEPARWSVPELDAPRAPDTPESAKKRLTPIEATAKARGSETTQSRRWLTEARDFQGIARRLRVLKVFYPRDQSREAEANASLELLLRKPKNGGFDNWKYRWLHSAGSRPLKLLEAASLGALRNFGMGCLPFNARRGGLEQITH